MNITYCKDTQQMSRQAGSLVLAEIEKKNDLLLCAATGHSPEGLYSELERKSKTDPSTFKKLRVLKLDEWGGLPDNHPSSCEYFLRKLLLEPLNIPSERYISFESDPSDPEKECERIQSELDRHGPVDLSILGLGRNGHLGLNEPGVQLEPHCHVARLSVSSLQHSMLHSTEFKPRYGLTLGMQDILASKKILLLISGMGKGPVIREFLKREVSTQLPASFLWGHPDVACYIDRSSLE